jgi:hypothetical protein
MNLERATSAVPNLHSENSVLTWQLFEKMMAYYAVPRLRQRLAKINIHDIKSWVPQSRERDMVFLVSALRDFNDYAQCESHLADIGPLLGKYLRSLESFGIAIQHFLTRSAKNWEEIRPKYQELSRSYLSRALSHFFPGLPDARGNSVSSYLLTNSLARALHSFPFRKEQEISPLILIRTKTDFAWNPLESRRDLTAPLEFYFPEISWQENFFQDRKVWYLGIQLFSPLVPRTMDVIQRAFENRSHQCSSLVRNRKRLLYLAFYSELDMSIFKFNLSHFGKIAGTYYEAFPCTGLEFREGYPGMSGFIEEEFRAESATMGR